MFNWLRKIGEWIIEQEVLDARLYTHPQYGVCHGPSPHSMPKMFDELADYNSRVANGVVHEVDYSARMAQLQNKFNLWLQEIRAQTDPPPPPGQTHDYHYGKPAARRIPRHH